MAFSNKVTERLEDDRVILFNGLNGAMIEIDKDFYLSKYKQLACGAQEQDSEATDTDALRSWLEQNGFFNEASGANLKLNRSTYSSAFARQAKQFTTVVSKQAPLSMIWAFTPRCNIKCVYCYPEGNSMMSSCVAAPDSHLEDTVRQILEAKVLRVTISGGECMLDKRLWSVLAALSSKGVDTSIISNGTPVNRRNIERLKQVNTQIAFSLDGPTEAVNATSRGEGVFAKASAAIDLCVAEGMDPIVICTVHRHNFDHIEQLCDDLVARGVTGITLQDLRPFGSVANYRDWKLTPDQESRVRSLCSKLAERYPSVFFNFTELMLHYKTHATGRVMNCPAGRNFAYLDFTGDLYPCTSLPSMKMGNIHRDGDIAELWRHSIAMKELRNLQSRPVGSLESCSGCNCHASCEGGCRGEALFWSGSIEGRPSRCPKELSQSA